MISSRVCQKKTKKGIIPDLEKAGYLELKYYQMQGTEQVNSHECCVQISNIWSASSIIIHSEDGWLSIWLQNSPLESYITLIFKLYRGSVAYLMHMYVTAASLAALDSKTLKTLTKAHTEQKQKRAVQII